MRMSERVPEAVRRDVHARVDRRFDEFVEELRAYARVPTISARREAESEGALMLLWNQASTS
jgi:hypothetical protein